MAAKINVDAAAWQTGQHRLWRAAIVKISNRVHVDWLDAKPLGDACAGELAVSRPGTLAAATVTPSSGEPFIAVSVYAPWESPHSMTKGDFIYADASAYLISDLSVFASKRSRQNILVAGDLNVLHGDGEHGDAYWANRYETVFSRMAALGLTFVGPQAPNGRRAEPWPAELPRASNNVPTYHTKQQSPANAPASWISCLHPVAWPIACGSGRSTNPMSGGRAITAVSKLGRVTASTFLCLASLRCWHQAARGWAGTAAGRIIFPPV